MVKNRSNEMRSSLAIREEPTIWEDENKLKEIKRLFAPKLTDTEFQYFIGLGSSCNLNPFLREIWSVKYQDDAPAQVFIGRDGYRKAAQNHKEYDFHQCDAVYQNDLFEVNNGVVRHSYNLTNRGQLIGAYCIAKRQRATRPIYVFVELKEYSTGKSLWNKETGKPATMIKKVAESQCLRACFQDLFGGTYAEEEFDRTGNKSRIVSIDKNKTESEIIDMETGEILDVSDKATIDNIEKINSLFLEKNFDDERKKNALDYYKVSSVEELSLFQSERLIFQLQKVS
jgi:phage recombination protein Bet